MGSFLTCRHEEFYCTKGHIAYTDVEMDNPVTVEVRTGQNLSGFPTHRALSHNVRVIVSSNMHAFWGNPFTGAA